jgi:hypothetical protein
MEKKSKVDEFEKEALKDKATIELHEKYLKQC